ncbi:hypothetical protein SAY86_024410 [Trapa natans]|uniref:Uncharacterized protein n=1 Tax=Trapa natans TaxID=22666 RepID=A0AAN7MPD0_TRANT|nr:hypothetical protein SAY86_024410 [Trapa natans]
MVPTSNSSPEQEMLFSVQAGKSGSNWLDRLRSTKGFPTAPNLGLDHFLSSPQSPTPSISEPVHPIERRPAGWTPAHAEDSRKEWYGIMTNVLSELFHMGDADPLPPKKSSRKQANPRFFPGTTGGVEDSLQKIDNALSFNLDNNLVHMATDLWCREEGEEDEEDEDLAGYSKSEVTVIDTSCSGWKLEKVLFRRKNVWKVKDRKGKGRSGFGRKKRRASGGRGEEIVLGKKKRKRSSLALESTNEGDEVNRSGLREAHERIADGILQSQRRRLPIFESPTKLKNGSSSVVLVKGIAAGKGKKANISNTTSSNSTASA